MRTTLSLTCLFLFCDLSVVHAQARPATTPVSQSQALRNAARALAAKYDYDGANHQLKQAYSLDKPTRLQDAATDLTMIGENEIRVGRDTSALNFLQQALPLRRRVGDRKGEAQTLSKLGEACGDLSQYAKALAYCQQALPLRRAVQDGAGEAETLNVMGVTYVYLSQYDKALALFRQGLAIALQTHDHKDEVEALGGLGISYVTLSQSKQGLDYLTQALSLSKRIGDKVKEARTLRYFGFAYGSMSQYDKAIDYHQQALLIFREVKDRAGEAVAFANMGRAYNDLRQYDKAIGYFQQALLIFREIRDRAGEAIPLAHLGAAYVNISQYDNAIDYYQKALLIYQEVQDRAAEANTLYSLGRAYRHLSQYAKAVASYQQALSIRREEGDRAGEAYTLTVLGVAYEHLSQYDKAVDHFQQALPIYRKVGDRAGEADTFNNLGAAYDGLRQYAKAVDSYQQALPIRREVGDRAGEAATLGNLGAVYGNLSQYAKAVDYFQQALLIFREVQDRGGEADALNNLMLSWKTLHASKLAIWYGKQAVNVYQSIRQDVQGLDKQTQKTYLAANETSYRTLATLLMSQNRLPEAEQVLGMLKEQEFFSFVQRDAKVAPAATLTRPNPEEAALEQRYTQIADQVTALGAERGTLVEKDTNNTLTPAEHARLDSLEKDLAAANQHFQTFYAQLQTQLAGTAVAKTAADLGDAEGMQTALKTLGKGTVALYTLETADSYYVLLVTPDAQKVEQFAIPKEQMDRKITLFRQALRDPARDPRPLAQELYTILFCKGALARDLDGAGAKTLLWSLDGSLGYLPMAALYDGKQYLVEKYRTAVFTPVSKANLTLPVSPTWKGLGLGVSQAHQVAGEAGQPPDEFQALPGAAAELRGIIGDGGDPAAGQTAATTMPGTIQMDDAFTEDALRTGLHRQYPLVHIASHFQFSPGDDTHSYLLLGDGRTLTAADMKRMPGGFTGVQLLTLSACSTAMGGAGADGTEVEGFAALVQKKGAAAVLASLWEVSDDSTSQLMQKFYRLREAGPGTTKAEALRQAQIELLKGKAAASALPSKTNRANRAKIAGAANADLPLFVADPKAPYAHPFYWAAFVLIGNPQ